MCEKKKGQELGPGVRQDPEQEWQTYKTGQLLMGKVGQRGQW